MSLLVTLLAFLFALGILIVIHELGHYAVARLCGVKVLRFSVGFGTSLWRRQLGADRTEWVVAAVPVGGYVKMLDEREGEVPAHERHRAFNRKSVYRRFAIVAAGPIANFLLAIVVYWAVFLHGIPGLKPVLGTPVPGTPAAQAGIVSGETIVRIGDQPVATWEDVRWLLLEQAVEKGSVSVEVENDKGEIAFRRLDLAGLTAADLDSDFLTKIGLARFSPALIGEVQAGKAGARAGLRPGDDVVAVDGRPITTWEELVAAVQPSADKRLMLTIRRGGESLQIPATPDTVQEGGHTIGRLGVARDLAPLEKQMVQVRYGPLQALEHAGVKTWEISVLSLQMLGKMVTGQVSLKNLSGPITIADYAGQSAQMGLLFYVRFIALISISLGVLNLLPVPVLDGGHLMYYIVEIIKGRPVSERVLEIGQRIGMVVLFTLMAFAIYNDIHRLVGG